MPITKDEVARSIYKVRNNSASGYNQIPPGLLKYAPPELRDLIVESINSIFAKRKKFIYVGYGLLVALQMLDKRSSYIQTFLQYPEFNLMAKNTSHSFEVFIV